MPSRGGGGLFGVLAMLFFRGSAKVKIFMLIILAVGFIFFRGPLMQALGFTDASLAGGPATEQVQPDVEDKTRAYLETMIGDNEDVWKSLLPQHNVQYRPAKMVIYTQATRTPGGLANAQMGPFYLPQNETIYLDPTFFDELKQKFGASGDFAEAYVVAHEYGHHIQNILGRLDQLHSQQGRISKTAYNKQSVRVELHADFLSGVFAHHAQSRFKEFLEAGDIEEAMRAAQAIGDDRLQRDFGSGYVQPDSFTHGTSAQRAKWFRRGFESGDLRLGEQIYTLPYEQL